MVLRMYQSSNLIPRWHAHSKSVHASAIPSPCTIIFENSIHKMLPNQRCYSQFTIHPLKSTWVQLCFPLSISKGKWNTVITIFLAFKQSCNILKTCPPGLQTTSHSCSPLSFFKPSQSCQDSHTLKTAYYSNYCLVSNASDAKYSYYFCLYV